MFKWKLLAVLLNLANLASTAPISKTDVVGSKAVGLRTRSLAAEALWSPSKAEELWTRSPKSESNAEVLWIPSKAQELWTREPKSESNAEALWTPSKAEELWTREPKSESNAEALWTPSKAEELWT
ncbi:hypothetical protein MMC22_003123 [Lobaria immixta]|nr:hypothetical protein [Lobaria immixta]